jgi:tetratricopeptide (TPR) repeat protein
LEKAAGQWVLWNKNDPDNWSFLALAKGRLNKPKEKANALLMVAKLAPSAEAWLLAAEELKKVGASAEARAAYENVSKLDPNNAIAGQALLDYSLQDLANKSKILSK